MHSLRNEAPRPPGGGGAAGGRAQTLEQDSIRHRAQGPVSGAGRRYSGRLSRRV